MNPLIYFLLFFKASLFSTGGLGNLPSLHQDLLGLGWATDYEFGQAIAVGQISPGPNGLWVICLGYLTFGYLGALLALIAICLPPFLVLALAAVHNRIEHKPSVRGMLRGISLAVVGLTMAVVLALISAPNIDWKGWLIAFAAFALSITGKVGVLVILLGGGVAGFLFYGL